MAKSFDGFTYQEGLDRLGKQRRTYRLAQQGMTIGRNTTLMHNINTPDLHVMLHGHNIVTLYPDGAVRLDSCGYRTATTKHRMDAFVNVFQRNHEWYVETAPGGGNIKTTPFYDGITIYADGTVRQQAVA